MLCGTTSSSYELSHPALGRWGRKGLWWQKWAHVKSWQRLLGKGWAELEVPAVTKGQIERSAGPGGVRPTPQIPGPSILVSSSGNYKVKEYVTSKVFYRGDVIPNMRCNEVPNCVPCTYVVFLIC